MKKIVLASLILCVNLEVFAHEIYTHQKIGDAAVAYLQALSATQTPQRPLPLGSVKALHSALLFGAKHEDDGFGVNVGINPYGRFIFHFTPALNNNLSGLLTNISANNCSSIGWSQSTGFPDGSKKDGNDGCAVSCFSVIPVLEALCLQIAGNNHDNSFRWDQDLTAEPGGYPTVGGLTGLGYVIHLLEDLGSPPHTRNDGHPCPVGRFYCDQFEKFNDNEHLAPFGDPQELPGGVWQRFIKKTISSSGVPTQVISTSGFATPAEFLDALQDYTCKYYYSNRTAFQACYNGQTGPTSVYQDSNYFWGACVTSDSGVPVSEIAGTCHFVNNQFLRRIAHKGKPFNASCNAVCDPTKADIDQTIAREQFDELGPVIAQHVAAFLQFYAPALTVTTSGTGTGQVTAGAGGGTQITCTSAQSGTAACSGLFVQTTTGPATVTLTAKPDPGYTFTGWTGDCSGSALTTTVTASKDLSCTATFSPSSKFDYYYSIWFGFVQCGQTVSVSFSAMTASGSPLSGSASYVGCSGGSEYLTVAAGGGPDFAFTGQVTSSSSGTPPPSDIALCAAEIDTYENINGTIQFVYVSVWQGRCSSGGGVFAGGEVGTGPQ